MPARQTTRAPKDKQVWSSDPAGVDEVGSMRAKYTRATLPSSRPANVTAGSTFDGEEQPHLGNHHALEGTSRAMSGEQRSSFSLRVDHGAPKITKITVLPRPEECDRCTSPPIMSAERDTPGSAATTEASPPSPLSTRMNHDPGQVISEPRLITSAEIHRSSSRFVME